MNPDLYNRRQAVLCLTRRINFLLVIHESELFSISQFGCIKVHQIASAECFQSNGRSQLIGTLSLCLIIFYGQSESIQPRQYVKIRPSTTKSCKAGFLLQVCLCWRWHHEFRKFSKLLLNLVFARLSGKTFPKII